jgi:bifunctional non-homologous end joining protein LigD
MGDPLVEYRRKRDPAKTPEPVPDQPPAAGAGDIFVIQQHHARALHWDLRLERAGVLASWAVPRGIPRDPARNHLAVQTEDHPMEYADFHGEIPEGEYGGGRMVVYDRGTYATEKWRDDEVMIVLRGERVSGRYVLFRTDGKNWMIHRMDPLPPGWTPMPRRVEVKQAVPATRLPADDGAWAYELAWSGRRAVAQVSGGRLRLLSADGREITGSFPDLRGLGDALAPTECVLDGVIVAFDTAGRISEKALRPRLGAKDSRAARRLTDRIPVQYLAFDLLWLDGRPTVEEEYRGRRELLEALGIAGTNWQTPPVFPSGGGQHARETAAAHGLAAVIAKRLDSPYVADGRARHWVRVPIRPGTAAVAADSRQ